MKKLLLFILLTGSAFLLGCDNSNDEEAAALQAISITASYGRIPADVTMQYTATGTHTDGSTADVTNSVSWSSSDTTKAAIDNTGLLTSIDTGETNINATAGGITSNTLPLSVVVITIDHLAVVPEAVTMPQDTNENLQAFAVATTGEAYDISTSTNVTWSSAAIDVATIDANGLVAAISVGSSTMTASFEAKTQTFTATSEVTVQAASTSDIRIEPLNSFTVTEFFLRFKAFDVSTGRDISSTVTWSSDDKTIADIDDSGVAETGDAGTAVITATTASGITAATTLAVEDAELLSIRITDTNEGKLPVGFGFLYKATGNYSNGSQPDMTKLVDWKADDDDIADFIDATGGPFAGTIRAYAVGSTEVTATYGTLLGDIQGKTLLVVTLDDLVSIELTPPDGHIANIGDVFQYTPTGTFASGDTLDLNHSVATAWSPADTTIVIVDTVGKAFALSAGNTSVKVNYLLIEDTATVTVNP